MKVTRGEVTLAVHASGEPAGPVVVLLHGYPDSSAVWSRVVERLGSRFRVVRPDGRGCGASTAPADRSGYRLDELASDVLAVADAVSPLHPVHLVGHDWGAVQGWEAVWRRPDRFATFTSVSGPCLDHVGHWLRTAPRLPVLRQLAMSWYVAAIRVPVLPELAWRLGRARGWAGGTRVRDGVHGLELYRANVADRIQAPRERYVRVPTQLVVLGGDPFVSPALADAARPWVADLTRVELDAGHWAPWTHARELAGLIDGFTAREPAQGC